MLGKIIAFVLSLSIASTAGIEFATAAPAAPAKPAKPVHKAAPKGQPAAAQPRPAKRKPAVAQGTKAQRPAAKRPQAVRTSQRSAAPSRNARPAKKTAMRASARMARPGSRLPARPTSGRPAATSDAAVVADNKRRSTRFGRMPTFTPPLGPLPDTGADRTLSFYNVHTGESLVVTYWRDGQYVQSELDRLNAFLADRRNGDQVQMDPALFDILWRVRRQLRSTATYRVLSAYRSPQTNAWLASVSSGVASDSLHMRGQAMDIMLPGRTAGQIRQAARALGLGGVGYYPRSGFVHLDTGPVRYW
ncbi:DUF882 domain-containing protein [Vineibacter terrae]|uniref:Murein endopeptidase K n=1 Tax=Vineibacter terrae TaxID=2586908 RepID=A0A5C8PHD8_9HYPH|nr:DUF882 domain-containing protein [Vineibacter terrae]TXL73061.1 DUF882 domain-containing protein [Vineibacter terrae]